MQLLVLQHLKHEDAGSIKSWAAVNGHSLDVILVPALTINYPPLSQYDGLFVLGGTMV